MLITKRRTLRIILMNSFIPIYIIKSTVAGVSIVLPRLFLCYIFSCAGLAVEINVKVRDEPQIV